MECILAVWEAELALGKLPKRFLRITKDHLRITKDHLRITKDHLRITKGHLRITKGHLRITKDFLRLPNDHLRITNNRLRITNNHLRITNNQSTLRRIRAPCSERVKRHSVPSLAPHIRGNCEKRNNRQSKPMPKAAFLPVFRDSTAAKGLAAPMGRGLLGEMSALTEIEAAVEKLPPAEQAELLRFLASRMRERESRNRTPRDELLAKWRERTTDVVRRSGGTQEYLNAIRGRVEDGR